MKSVERAGFGRESSVGFSCPRRGSPNRYGLTGDVKSVERAGFGRGSLKLGDSRPESGSANGVTGVTIPVPKSDGRGGGRGIFFEGKPRGLEKSGKTA